MLKMLFSQKAVVAELKEGPLKPIRAKNFLLTFVVYTTLVQVATMVAQASLKPDANMIAVLGALGGGLVGGGIGYLVSRWLIGKLWEANGAHEGERFYERLFVLLLSASLRLAIPLVPFLAGSIFLLGWALPRLQSTALIVLVSFGFVALIVIAPVAYIYTRIKAGLLELKSSSSPSV